MDNEKNRKAVKFLRGVHFFQDLGEKEIENIAEACREESFSKGKVIFSEGTRPEYFYIVIEGSVEVWKDYYGRTPDLLALHGRGHLFGEMSLLDDLPRSATVVARDSVKVLTIYRDDFHKILTHDPQISLLLLKSLSSMIRNSNEHFVEGLRDRNRELQQANEELKVMQDELLKSERLSNLGKFSSLILHDIRNPISILRSYAEMILLNTDDAEKIKKYTRIIIKEADRLNLLAGELLDYSRGEIRLNLSIVSIPQFFEKLSSHIQENLKAAGIELFITNEVTEPVILDEERMLRVFINLCDNSRKAMDGTGTITVSAVATDTNIVLSVADTGNGMTKEILANIFEPFYSFSKQGGTGLGLVIVKNVVEAHEGTLSVQSRVKHGTTVEIRLPRR